MITLNIKISLLSATPIYLQIVEQIKNIIVQEKLEHTPLPSIRALSKELEVGIITVKKAYEQLVAENYIYSKSGVGYFVQKINFDKVHQNNIKQFAEQLGIVIRDAKEKQISQQELVEIFKDKVGEIYDEY